MCLVGQSTKPDNGRKNTRKKSKCSELTEIRRIKVYNREDKPVCTKPGEERPGLSVLSFLSPSIVIYSLLISHSPAHFWRSIDRTRMHVFVRKVSCFLGPPARVPEAQRRGLAADYSPPLFLFPFLSPPSFQRKTPRAVTPLSKSRGGRRQTHRQTDIYKNSLQALVILGRSKQLIVVRHW